MRKALIVGIDNYPKGRLLGCCNDADAMNQLLRNHGDGSPNFSTKLAKDVSTKSQLLQLIDECFSGDADVALFYYSGHGHIDSIGGYLVTPDYSNFDFGV